MALPGSTASVDELPKFWPGLPFSTRASAPAVNVVVRGAATGVVNVQTLSAGSGLPAGSVTPPGPPLTVAVKAAPAASAAAGVRTALREAASHVTVAATAAPVASASVYVVADSDAGATGSLKAARTAVAAAVAPLAGVTAVTAGGVVSIVHVRVAGSPSPPP